ncbi:MAG TPA: BON domain-containing protein [Bryobacteraceae bacterium]|nr:BON domain-containing protein [Bryobacteraceae bacterium]
MKTINKLALALTGGLLAMSTLLPAATANRQSEKPIGEKVRHELVMLPFYNVFDNLAYRVNGSEVHLYGQVTRPTLKSSAENVVKSIPGITHVHNEIEVLPLSPFDDRLRLALYRAIYSQPALNRYALGAIPGIHIIVRNGNVTLEGVVASEMDRNIAYLRANGVSGAFSVANNLQVAGKNRER